jgi:IS1 family transposase/transposase-like protein
MKERNHPRPPLESLACVNLDCDLYGQEGGHNLRIRKVYGRDHIRYLRCRCCQQEFSERKNTALWNSKIPEEKAVSVAEHLADGCGIKSTVRLVKVDPSTVRRLNGKAGKHGQQYHEQEVREVAVTELQADERYGFAGSKGQPAWEAELIDPASKFIVAHVQGPRDESLIRRLLADGAARLQNRQEVALFTDGLAAYRTLFPEIFGNAYYPPRQGTRGPHPQARFRIPRTAAHAQIIKHQRGYRLQAVEIRYTHGSKKRIEQALERLGYHVPNTSAIERRNGTARLMSAAQVRKTLAFAGKESTKAAMGWWGLTVYNWCRPHRSLKQLLSAPVGKKSLNRGHRLWPSG